VCAYATYSRGSQWVPMYEAQIPEDWKFIIEVFWMDDLIE